MLWQKLSVDSMNSVSLLPQRFGKFIYLGNMVVHLFIASLPRCTALCGNII